MIAPSSLFKLSLATLYIFCVAMEGSSSFSPPRIGKRETAPEKTAIVSITYRTISSSMLLLEFLDETPSVACCPSQCSRSLLSALQGHYCLGVSLRHQIRYKDSCMHLEKALSAAFEVQDSIKDSIWRELAACKHAFWVQQSTVRGDKRERLRSRMAAFMDAYFLANPSVRPFVPFTRLSAYCACMGARALPFRGENTVALDWQ